jgi:predicted nucleic acid-binding protein
MSSTQHTSEHRIVVVDSSVAVKWFKSEGERSLAQAWELLEAHREGALTLAVPGHFPAEVLNGLQYARLALDDVRAAATAIARTDLVAVPLSRRVTESAVALAQAHRLTVNDALFPALAMLLDCELVTADRAQARVTECPVRLLR